MKNNTWTYDQQIQYELALDTISSLKAILRRQAYVIKDEKKIKALRARSIELAKEKYNFNGFDDEIVKSVIDTYSELIREYYTMGETEEEIANIGLPDKFITTKVIYKA
jgi:hypothetical protein